MLHQLLAGTFISPFFSKILPPTPVMFLFKGLKVAHIPQRLKSILGSVCTAPCQSVSCNSEQIYLQVVQ